MFLLFSLRSFRFWRLAAVNYALESLKQAPSTHRIRPTELQLCAILTYMLNAINYRPGERSWEQKLCIACALHVGAEDDEAISDVDEANLAYYDGNMVPYIHERGAYFIGDIRANSKTKSYRLPIPFSRPRQLQGMLPLDELALIYNQPTEETLVSKFNVTLRQELVRKARGAQPMRQRRQQQTVPIALVRHQDEQTDLQLGLADAGIHVRPGARLEGPDARRENEILVERMENDPDTRVARIWEQFGFDVLHVAPISSNNIPYCPLTEEEKEEISRNNAVFRQPALPLTCAQLVRVHDARWRGQIFESYFPSKGSQVKAPRQFIKAIYWTAWNALMQDLSQRDAGIVRQRMQSLFCEFLWLPLPLSDRMWATKKSTGDACRIPAPEEGEAFEPAPQIAVNSARGVRLGAFTLKRPTDPNEDVIMDEQE